MLISIEILLKQRKIMRVWLAWGNADWKLADPLLIGAEETISWTDVENVIHVAFKNQLDE